jgi:SAM-dependent methyltransferase
MTGAARPAASAFDAAAWIRRWELQQARYVPDRESTFALMLDILRRLEASPGRVLDLGCGPGALAARVLSRWPAAEVTGLDFDPVLLELGKRTLGSRVRWIEADLRDPSWSRRLDGAPLDAAVSATALHWLRPAHLNALARGLASNLRTGGVFANYDTMLLDAANPRLRALSHELRLALSEAATACGGEDWDDWWQALRAEPELAHPFAERDRRFNSGPQSASITLRQLVRALRAAGFQEVATLKQVANRHLLVAIR